MGFLAGIFMNIHPKSLEAYKLLHNGVLTLAKAERQGIRIDIEYVEKKEAEINQKIKDLETQLYNSNFFKEWKESTKSKVNINSNPQLQYFLYTVKGYEPQKFTDSGQGATDEEALKTLGVRNFDVAVVSIGDNIHANILSTLILKALGVPYVVVKAQDNLHGKVLTKVGADRVVYPEQDMGVRIAHNLISSNVLDYIEVAPDYSVVEIMATENMIGKSLQELEIRSKYNVNVMAIKRGQNLNISPGASDKILEEDILIVMGENENLDQVKEL